MRITIVQGHFLPVPPILGGAVEKVWYALGREFASRGHTVTHISRAHEGLSREEVVEDVRHVRVPGAPGTNWQILHKTRDLWYSLRALRRLPEADILVTNTFWMPILARASKWGRLYVHVARYPKGQMWLYRHVNRLQTVSTPIAQAIVREDPSLRSLVRVVPYPLPGDLSGVSEERVAGDRARCFLYVGRVHPEKGVHLLVEAFKRIAPELSEEWKLKIVGPWRSETGGGGKRYVDRLKGMSSEFADRIEWVGPVFEEDRLKEYYLRAGVFVYPSLADKGETFGLAPLEAMSCGCPPVVSGLACFQDFIDPGRSGIVFDHEARDPARELGASMKKLASDSSLRQKMGEVSYRRSADYGLEQVADQYLQDFRSLISCRSGDDG